MTPLEIENEAINYANHKMSYGLYPGSSWLRFYRIRKEVLKQQENNQNE